MELEIRLNKNSYYANEKVAGNIEFSQPLFQDVKGLKLIAKGEERTKIIDTQQVEIPDQGQNVDADGDGFPDPPSINTTTTGQDADGDGFPDPPSTNTTTTARTNQRQTQTQTVTLEESDVFFQKKIELTALTSPAKFEFTLPSDARSSYKGKCAWLTYHIRAIADLWGPFDPAKDVEFKVHSPDASPSSGTKVTFEEQKDDLHISVELQKNVFTPGENIVGNMTIQNPSKKKIKNFEVILRGVEVASAKNVSRTTTVEEYKKQIGWNNETTRFDIQIPKGVNKRYSGKYFGYYWELELRLDLGFFSGDISMSRRIEVI
jgi:hypothetical protein